MPPLAPETAEAAARDCAEGTEEGGCVCGDQGSGRRRRGRERRDEGSVNMGYICPHKTRTRARGVGRRAYMRRGHIRV